MYGIFVSLTLHEHVAQPLPIVVFIFFLYVLFLFRVRLISVDSHCVSFTNFFLRGISAFFFFCAFLFYLTIAYFVEYSALRN